MVINVDIRGGKKTWEEQKIIDLAKFALESAGAPQNSELSVSLVDVNEIHALNKEYRGIDKATDVLSFECDNVCEYMDACNGEAAGGKAANLIDACGADVADGEKAAGCEAAVSIDACGADVAGGKATRSAGITNDAANKASQAFASGEPITLGDIVIACDVVNEQRAQFGTSFDEEMSLMLVHGCLHVLGFDHIDEREAEEMEALEKDILEAYGISGVR